MKVPRGKPEYFCKIEREMKSAIMEARKEADRPEYAAHGNMEQASGDGHHVKKALYMKVPGGKPTYFPKK